MKKLITSLMVFASLSISVPRAHAVSPLTYTVIGTLAVTAVAAYLVASDTGSIQASTKNKEAALNIIAEDAAVFVMNNGEDASDLLRSLMTQMRDTQEFSKIDEKVSDLDLAYAILSQADVDLE